MIKIYINHITRKIKALIWRWYKKCRMIILFADTSVGSGRLCLLVAIYPFCLSENQPIAFFQPVPGKPPRLHFYNTMGVPAAASNAVWQDIFCYMDNVKVAREKDYIQAEPHETRMNSLAWNQCHAPALFYCRSPYQSATTPKKSLHPFHPVNQHRPIRNHQ